MKINENDVKNIISIIEIANSIGLEAISIEPTVIRAINSEKTVLLIENNNLPKIDYCIGVSRIKTLRMRFSLLPKDVIPEITCTTRAAENGDTFVTELAMKNKRTNITFRCSEPKSIVSPKKFTSNIHYSFNIDDGSINFMAKARSAMEVDLVSLILKTDGVYYSVNDTEGDSLNHLISSDVKLIDNDAEKTFLYNYNHKILLPLLKLGLKNNSELLCNITKRGVLNFLIDGYNVYITPVLK